MNERDRLRAEADKARARAEWLDRASRLARDDEADKARELRGQADQLRRDADDADHRARELSW